MKSFARWCGYESGYAMAKDAAGLIAITTGVYALAIAITVATYTLLSIFRGS